MDLSKLKWIKNIKHQAGEEWSAQGLQEFDLTWRNLQNQDNKNANKPQKGELMILKQNGKVTHIVEILDEQPHPVQNASDEFNIYRHVKTVWITKDWVNPPTVKTVLDYDFNYQSGKALELETLPTFQKHWDARGGLAAFQNHVQKLLNAL